MHKPIPETIAARRLLRTLPLLALLAPSLLLGCWDSTGEISEGMQAGSQPAEPPPAPPSSPPSSAPDAGAARGDIAAGGAPDGGNARADGSGSAPEASPPVAPVPTPSAAITGTLVPLYTYPTDPSWRVVAEGKLAHPSVPVIAVINPDSGPGASLSADYVKGIATLRTAGVSVLGYVSTDYTKRAEAAVRADIDNYRLWYPQTTGIFFDEQTNSPGGEDYYRRVDAYARSKGFTFTVGNPGSDSAPTYVGTVDMMLVYESAGLPGASVMGGWHTSYDRHNFGVIPYGVPTLDPAFIARAKASVGYIYITGDTLPNPWDTIPPYFSEMMAELAK